MGRLARDSNEDAVDEHCQRLGFQNGDISQFAADLLAIRNWERGNIPHFKPQIALDVLLYAFVSSRRSKPSPTKEAHLEIGHSQDRVRETITMLVNENWLLREPCRNDRRVVRLQPTEQTMRLVLQYEQYVRGFVNRPK